MVGQVRVVGILMAVQGGLSLLMGGFFVVYGILLPMFMAEAMKADPNMRRNGGVPPEEVLQWMTLGMGIGGGVLIFISILEIFAGIRAYQFRSRGLVVGALIAGLLPVLSCYCAPTAIAMAVYGLIVMFNAQVIGAFEMGQRGLTGDQIIGSFYQRQS